MSKNIYQVLVTYEQKSNVLIEAESEQEARKMVQELLDEGCGRFEEVQADHANTIDAVVPVFTPDADDTKQAKANVKNYQDFLDENN